MGLDNGIVLKGVKKENLSTFFLSKCDDYNERTEELDVCYWRKCWNLRNEIFEVIKSGSNETYEYSLDEEDIGNIIDILYVYIDEYTWNNSDSIWEYEVMKNHLIGDVVRLSLLLEYLEEYPDAEVYFYDSY